MPELLNACSNQPLVVQLHLGDLISVDPVGLDALHSLCRGGTKLLEVPAYIQLKLDSHSSKHTARRQR